MADPQAHLTVGGPAKGDAARDPTEASPATTAVCVEPSVADLACPTAYHAHRISLGVPEPDLDYPLGDTFPHEADFDLFHGADFDKGCFVGQEVVARMQHKAVVRKRVVRVSAGHDLPSSHPDITSGPTIIGRLGSVTGRRGLALIRLDRAAEAIDKGQGILADGIPLTVETQALAAYRAGSAAKPGQS